MPTFDVVSEVDMQEVKNAVDQASREVANRFDFKDTDSTIEISASELKLASSTEDRLKALVIVLEEKLVKRQVSLKSLDRGPVIEGSRGAVRQTIKVVAGISSDKAKEISKFIRESGIKGAVPSIQGDQLRVQSKKRDDLQEIIQLLKEHEFDIPLQFVNFRD
ncbi:MAG: YajQ family cyclic di-GMP-binding protein [Acidimicrobiaceae bacterium]|nr:YajQ family cyclic di-GMP-binding protein [Acidimicrobiaceae bacterium]